MNREIELKDLEPTPPDHNGDQWRRPAPAGRARWVCDCGEGSEWAPTEGVNAEADEHAKSHMGEA